MNRAEKGSHTRSRVSKPKSNAYDTLDEILEPLDYFHDSSKNCFIDIIIGSSRQTLRIESKDFENYLAEIDALIERGAAPTALAMSSDRLVDLDGDRHRHGRCIQRRGARHDC